MVRVFKVTIYERSGDASDNFSVAAKDDLQARGKAISQWVKKMNVWLHDARENEPPKDRPTRKSDYSSKDVVFCEIEFITEAS